MQTKIILLGTAAGVTPKEGRTSPAAVVCVGPAAYLVDCSSGVAPRLLQAGVQLGSLKSVFTTHHHLDHVADVGILGMLAWSQLSLPLHFFGAPPLGNTIRCTLDAHRDEINERVDSEGRAPLDDLIVINEIKEGQAVGIDKTIYSDEYVSVSICRVNHPPIQSFAYRFNILNSSKAIVFSGDTSYCPELAEFARGADILVHEAYFEPALETAFANYNTKELLKRIQRSHTKVQDAGTIATKANIKKLILSPLSPSQGVSDEQWRTAAAETFDGEIIVGKDQMNIELSNQIENQT